MCDAVAPISKIDRIWLRWRCRALGRHRLVHRDCTLNGIEPLGCLTDVLTRIVNGRPNSLIDELLHWVYIRATERKAVA
jgi:hypothetical protein